MISDLLSATYRILKTRRDLLDKFLQEIDRMSKLPRVDIDALMELAQQLKDLETALLFGDTKLELTRHLLGAANSNAIQPVLNDAPNLAQKLEELN